MKGKQISSGAYVYPGINRNLISITDAVDVICRELRVSLDDLRQKTRKRRVVAPRQLCAYILRYNGFTLTQIGALLGKDHATIMSSCTRVENDMLTDRALRETVYRLRATKFRTPDVN